LLLLLNVSAELNDLALTWARQNLEELVDLRVKMKRLNKVA
jgi:hypothetical protein